MKNLKVIEIKGQRVLTTKQLAEAYGTEPERIKLNYRHNKNRFGIGKHVIQIEGEELREFKTRYQFDTQFKHAKSLYLWTEKGALLHAKSLNTDKAWEVYENLVDFYFRAKEEKPYEAKGQQAAGENPSEPEKSASPAKWMKRMVVDVPENPEAQKLIQEMRRYLVGMDAVLDVYSMYLKKEEFEKVGYTVDLVASKISRIGLDLMTFHPHLVEKFL